MPQTSADGDADVKMLIGHSHEVSADHQQEDFYNMVTKTITEQRAEVRIFAGNDPAHTATGSSGDFLVGNTGTDAPDAG